LSSLVDKAGGIYSILAKSYWRDFAPFCMGFIRLVHARRSHVPPQFIHHPAPGGTCHIGSFCLLHSQVGAFKPFKPYSPNALPKMGLLRLRASERTPAQERASEQASTQIYPGHAAILFGRGGRPPALKASKSVDNLRDSKFIGPVEEHAISKV